MIKTCFIYPKKKPESICSHYYLKSVDTPHPMLRDCGDADDNENHLSRKSLWLYRTEYNFILNLFMFFPEL